MVAQTEKQKFIKSEFNRLRDGKTFHLEHSAAGKPYYKERVWNYADGSTAEQNELGQWGLQHCHTQMPDEQRWHNIRTYWTLWLKDYLDQFDRQKELCLRKAERGTYKLDADLKELKRLKREVERCDRGVKHANRELKKLNPVEPRDPEEEAQRDRDSQRIEARKQKLLKEINAIEV